MEHYKAATLLHPTPVNYHNLALIYAKLGRGQESEVMFKKALELRPDYAEAYFNLGVLYAKTGQYENTVESLKQAIHFKPSYSNARYHLALAYLARGDRNSAMEQYKALLNLDQKSAERLLAVLQQPTAKNPSE
jgi:tetratricopeptide (TPR) repeat protein